MPELKLARIPDRTPVKLTITVLPDLHLALNDYARIYAETYGREEPVADLIPAILSAFLESDRGFVRAREALGREKARGVVTMHSCVIGLGTRPRLLTDSRRCSLRTTSTLRAWP